MNPQDTSAESKPDLPLEIAHLLLTDVVGFSKLLLNEQIELLQKLNQIVRGTESFRSAEASGKLNRVPTGDGMALLFFRNLEEPVRCAFNINVVSSGESLPVPRELRSSPCNGFAPPLADARPVMASTSTISFTVTCHLAVDT